MVASGLSVALKFARAAAWASAAAQISDTLAGGLEMAAVGLGVAAGGLVGLHPVSSTTAVASAMDPTVIACGLDIWRLLSQLGSPPSSGASKGISIVCPGARADLIRRG